MSAQSTTSSSSSSSLSNQKIRKAPYPLTLPYRSAVEGFGICRHFNYKGCCKKGDECDLDHGHCHICLQVGHIALQCSIYLDEALFCQFQKDASQENAHHRSMEPKRTVLGDIIQGWEPTIRTDDDLQLRRCKRHKQWEAERLLKIPMNSTFVDAGAHYGDTVITMALHAKTNGRDDINFVAIEPCRSKCDWIQKVAKKNDLQVFFSGEQDDNQNNNNNNNNNNNKSNNGSGSITIVQACVGDAETGWVIPAVIDDTTRTAKQLIQGNLAYRKIETAPPVTMAQQQQGREGNETVASRMITLDSLRDLIAPLGFLHLDVEGWEARALEGAKRLLSETTTTTTTTSNSTCWVVAEVWETRKGLSEDPEKAIEAVMDQHPHFHRGEDLVDRERNLVYFLE